MDALADYGSDSSSAASTSNAEKSAKNNKSKLSGLLDYSDEGESSDDGNETVGVAATKSNKNDAPTSSDTKRSHPVSDTTSRNKRKRSWDDAETENILPAPPLSTNDSLIQWDADYTAAYRTPPANVITSKQLMDKLTALESSDSVVSWAQHLKAQHEFHNPHFFDNVVTHFGIQRPLDSNVEEPIYQRFEYDLPAAEEQARIRQEQERQSSTASSTVHAPSQLAQQHFHRAMDRPRGMSM